jgi:hypothetical protein
MAKWASQLILDGGTDLLRTRAATAARVKYHVLKAYAAADSYATVLTNSLGSVDLVAADFAQSNGASAARVTTIAAKSITLSAGSGAGPDVHVAVVDSTTSEVLLVNDETSNAVMVAGGVFNAPAFTYTATQPT